MPFGHFRCAEYHFHTFCYSPSTAISYYLLLILGTSVQYFILNYSMILDRTMIQNLSIC
ncbi:MAG: phosphoethanolamine transferase domain-containing protein [Candidatus Malihini olakiniferum]